MTIASKALRKTSVEGRANLRRGLTLIEVTIALIITIFALAAGAQVYSEYLRNQANRAAAEHMRVISSAYSRYLHDNSGHIISLAKASPTRDVVDVVSVEELVDRGYLHAGFRKHGGRNSYGQRYVFYSKFRQEGADPEKGRLESFVYTEGGDAIDTRDALMISQLIGAGGAFVDHEHNIRSSYGDFTLQLSDIRAGADTRTGNLVTAMFFNDNNAVTSDYLYRNEASDPSLNVMNTNLGMGGFSIDNVDNIGAVGKVSAGSADITGEVSSGSLSTGSVNATTITASDRVTANEFIHLNRVVVEGASCAPNGLLGRDSDGMMLSCQSGSWKKAGGGGELRCEYFFWGRGGRLPANNASCPAGMTVTSVTHSGRSQRFRTVMGKSLYVGDVGHGYICCGIF